MSADRRPQGRRLEIWVDGPAQTVEASSTIRHLPVHTSIRQGAPPAPLSRWNDTSPYYGGAAIRTPSYYCSTAFAVHYPTDTLTDFQLTAAHCFSDLAEMWSNGQGVPMGPSYTWYFNEDAGLINVKFFPNSSAGNEMYAGLTDQFGLGQGERAEIVRGYSFNYNGDVVRSSGAFSGERGNIEIVNNQAIVFLSMNDGRVHKVFGIEARQQNGRNAFGSGDSGGPVFTYGVNYGVRARGVISAGYTDSPVPCTGITTGVGAGRECFSHVFFTDMFTILDMNDLVLN